MTMLPAVYDGHEHIMPPCLAGSGLRGVNGHIAVIGRARRGPREARFCAARVRGFDSVRCWARCRGREAATSGTVRVGGFGRFGRAVYGRARCGGDGAIPLTLWRSGCGGWHGLTGGRRGWCGGKSQQQHYNKQGNNGSDTHGGSPFTKIVCSIVAPIWDSALTDLG